MSSTPEFRPLCFGLAFLFSGLKEYNICLQGKHIDDLFNNNRQSRLESNAKLMRRPKRHVHFGDEPLVRFGRSNVIWQEYSASPSGQFHVDELIFTACHYRLRYAYDFTTQFDVDEFWAPGQKTEASTSLPDFLDQNMNKDAASIGFLQVCLPLLCAAMKALLAPSNM